MNETEYCYKSTLKSEYKLTDAWIKRLGEPDLIRPNPHYRSQNFYLYKRTRVEKFIKDHYNEIVAAQERRKKIAENKRQKSLEFAQNAQILFKHHGTHHIPDNFEVLVSNAEENSINHYMYNKYSPIWIKPSEIINYVAHAHTNLESLELELKGRVGREEALKVLRNRVADLIDKKLLELYRDDWLQVKNESSPNPLNLLSQKLWQMWRKNFTSGEGAIAEAVWIGNRLVKTIPSHERGNFYHLKDQFIKRYLEQGAGMFVRYEGERCSMCSGTKFVKADIPRPSTKPIRGIEKKRKMAREKYGKDSEEYIKYTNEIRQVNVNVQAWHEENRKTCPSCEGTGIDRGSIFSRVLYVHYLAVDGKSYCFHSYIKPQNLLEGQGEDLPKYGEHFTDEEIEALPLNLTEIIRMLHYKFTQTNSTRSDSIDNNRTYAVGLEQRSHSNNVSRENLVELRNS